MGFHSFGICGCASALSHPNGSEALKYIQYSNERKDCLTQLPNHFNDVDYASMFLKDPYQVFGLHPNGGCIIIRVNSNHPAHKRLVQIEHYFPFHVIQQAKGVTAPGRIPRKDMSSSAEPKDRLRRPWVFLNSFKSTRLSPLTVIK